MIDHRALDGRHYAKTAEAWIANMDRNREAVWSVLRGGQEWLVTHLLFEKPTA